MNRREQFVTMTRNLFRPKTEISIEELAQNPDKYRWRRVQTNGSLVHLRTYGAISQPYAPPVMPLSTGAALAPYVTEVYRLSELEGEKAVQVYIARKGTVNDSSIPFGGDNMSVTGRVHKHRSGEVYLASQSGNIAVFGD